MKTRTTLLVAVLCVAALTPLGAAAGPLAVGGGGAPASHGGGACRYPLTVQDATGETVTVSEEPERVVVVGASGAQTMWEIGAREKVVGMTVASYTTYLEGAENRTDVTGQYGYAQVEKVLAQDPDLVLLANIQKNRTANRLREAGVTVYKFNASQTLEDIYAKTRLTGRLVGACEGANETVTWMQDRVSTVEEAVENVDDRPGVLYPQTRGYAPGPGSFIHNVLTAAGGHNVVAEGNFSTSYPQVTNEFILQQNPDWLVATYNPELGQDASDPKALLPPNDAVNQTRAYREGNVVAVNANYLSQPAPRVVYPLTKLAAAWHPDAYAAANRTTTTTTTTTTTATTTETTTATGTSSTTTTTSPGQAGLGPLAGALALLLAAAAAGRRR